MLFFMWYTDDIDARTHHADALGYLAGFLVLFHPSPSTLRKSNINEKKKKENRFNCENIGKMEI